MKRYQCSDFDQLGRQCCMPPCCPPPGACPYPPQPPWPTQQPCTSGCIPTPWVLGGSYRAGQLTTHDGYLYVANVDYAAGEPGESKDFTLISTLQPIGPTGPVGGIGPTGPIGATGPAGATAAQ